MKKRSLFVLLIIILVLSACSSKPPHITKEYVAKNAKENLTKEEVKEAFGEPKIITNDAKYGIWLYDSEQTNESPKTVEFDPDFGHFEKILNGDVEYVFEVMFLEDKALQFTYFYKKDDNVWTYRTTGDNNSAVDEKATTLDE